MNFSVHPCDVKLDVARLSNKEHKLDFSWDKCEGLSL